MPRADRGGSAGDIVEGSVRFDAGGKPFDDVLAHESWHLRGVIDEGVTECRSLQTIA